MKTKAKTKGRRIEKPPSTWESGKRKPSIDIFTIDPPWPHTQNRPGAVDIREVNKRKQKQKSLFEWPFQTISYLRIQKLLREEILSRSSTDHIVFLWTFDRCLHQGESMMHRLGYKMHGRLIWNKGGGFPNPCWTYRMCHEYVTWFYKGRLIRPSKGNRGTVKSVFTEQSREKGRKPEVFYDMINRMYPDQTKMDVFSRTNRPGWQHFGDECGKFDTCL